MSKCRHKYRPRYNRTWSTDILDVVSHTVRRAKGMYGEPYLQKEIYVCDICIKCGNKK